MIRVRLTRMDCQPDEDLVVEGVVSDLPIYGEPFTVLLVDAGRLVVTRPVTWLSFETFATEDHWYVWHRVTPLHPVGEA